MGKPGARVLVLAARQPTFSELLEEAGYDVEVRTKPLAETDDLDAEVAVVFRGRLIGRTQAALLAERDVPVIEVLTVEPPGSSSGNWIRISNRVPKSDLVQLVHAVADWSSVRVGAGGEVAA